jgi:hypothetical protein
MRQLRENLLSIPGSLFVAAVEQVDHYYLLPGDSPSYLTETLCWREQCPYVDYDNELVGDDLGILVYKTSGFSSGRTTRSLATSDAEKMFIILEKVKQIRQGVDATPYSVSKRRIVYSISGITDEPVIINLDYDVVLGERTLMQNGEFDDVSDYAGNFVEITMPTGAEQQIDKIKQSLGIDGSPIDVPYIDKPRLTAMIHKVEPITVEVIENDEWSEFQYAPVYFDASDGAKFIRGIDPKISRKHADSLVEEVRNIIITLDRSHGGNDLKSTPGGKGGGASVYERYTEIDPFKRYPSLKECLNKVSVYRKKCDGRSGMQIIIFSVAEFIDGSKGTFIHYADDHDGYERWIANHRA